MAAPEQKAREIIDSKLAASAWIVQTYRDMNLGAGLGLAVTEFPGAHGPADYLLYVDGRAITEFEANPVGHTRFIARRLWSNITARMRKGI